jgi:hypothetical protein
MLGLWLVVFGLAQGCVTALPPECQLEGPARPMHCPDLHRRPANPEECRKIGGVIVTRDGRYDGCASQQDIRDMMRRWPQ